MSEECKVCGSSSLFFAKTQILQKYDVNYYQCSNCGFVQTESPYWLDEAYSEAIATSDVGLVYRNNMMADITAKLLFNYFDHDAKFLDYGGGYGLFVRLMRDKGFDFYWKDKFCKNIFAKGFELEESDKPNLLLITAFELFEHFIMPIEEIDEVVSLASNILFSTELLPDDSPKPDKWWYYATHEGQHISIYTKESLNILAAKYNLKLYTNNKNLHLLSDDKTLPENIFELIQSRNLLFPQKESLLIRDFNHVVNNLTNQKYESLISLPSSHAESDFLIIIDAVFFQLYRTGIARVWHSLLEEWSGNNFGKYILVLDRDNTAPKVAGIRYREIRAFSYADIDADSRMLQQVCNEEGCSLFISSYYTMPTTTPSVFMAYDMIPEVLGWDLNLAMWQQKHNAIQYASAYIAISQNTANDLIKFFPNILMESIAIAHCGVKSPFLPANEREIDIFKVKYGLDKPYFLLVGVGYGNSYKNTALFLEAYSRLAVRKGFDIVITGGGRFPSEYRAYTTGSSVHILQLSDQELAIAYSGALALVYPSVYEGFGMPVLEAMACGCPVITCPNASIPEVAGESAIYVDDNDVEEMTNALCEVQKPFIRQSLIECGLIQASKFSWTKMSSAVSDALLNASLLHLNLSENNLIVFPDWDLSQELIIVEIEGLIKLVNTLSNIQKTSLLIEIDYTILEYAEAILGEVTLNLLMQEDLQISEGLNVSFVSNLSDIQWEYLLTRLRGRIVMKQGDREVLPSSICESIPSYNSSLNN